MSFEAQCITCSPSRQDFITPRADKGVMNHRINALQQVTVVVPIRVDQVRQLQIVKAWIDFGGVPDVGEDNVVTVLS